MDGWMDGWMENVSTMHFMVIMVSDVPSYLLYALFNRQETPT